MDLKEWGLILFGTGGWGKVVWDIFTARNAGRKLKVDNAVALISSSVSYANHLTERVEAINNAFDNFRKQQETRHVLQEQRNHDQTLRDRNQDRLFRVHARWDDAVATKLAQLGSPVDPAPPLYVDEQETGHDPPRAH